MPNEAVMAALVDGELLGFELAAQIIGQRLGVLELGARQNDGEFLAAVTGYAAGVAHRLGQDRGEDLQGFIADRMAEGVVDILEVVDIAHGQAKGAAQGLRLDDGLGEVGTKAASIVA